MNTFSFLHRDARTEDTYEKVRKSIGSELIFAETGIQFMPINTIYHLATNVYQIEHSANRITSSGIR